MFITRKHIRRANVLSNLFLRFKITGAIIIIISFVRKPKIQQCITKDMDAEQDTLTFRQALKVAFQKKKHKNIPNIQNTKYIS